MKMVHFIREQDCGINYHVRSNFQKIDGYSKDTYQSCINRTNPCYNVIIRCDSIFVPITVLIYIDCA